MDVQGQCEQHIMLGPEKTIKKIENVEVTCRKAIVFIFTKT